MMQQNQQFLQTESVDKTLSESNDSTDKSHLMETNCTENVQTFEEMGLKKNLLRGIYGYDFEKPSQIQQKAIMTIIKGNDLIAQAQSGTGKTGAFAIGTLQLVDETINEVQILIMAPTREIAEQTKNFYNYIGEHLQVKIALLIGGTQVKQDIEKLKNGAQIVVGCPGRVLDMIKRKYLQLSNLKAFILDEADLMLSKGFLDNMREAISFIPPEAKILLFSATMPESIVELTTKFMTNPIKILVNNEDVTLKGIKQYYIPLKKSDKLDILLDLYRNLEIAQAVIFCNSINNVNYVSEALISKGHMVSAMYGEMKPTDRDAIMKSFRTGSTRVLVTTDLLARGIDIQQLSLVINYDLPFDKSTYVHRIGRSGRYGKKGTAINFVTTEEFDDLQQLIDMYKTDIEKLPSDLGTI